MNEKERIRRAKNGDQAAFEELVSAYEKKIYNMGLRYTGSQQDALDICQEVFLRLFRFIGQFNEASSFSTWLYRIAVNVCKDTIRKKQKVVELSFEVEDEEGNYEVEVSDLRYNPEDSVQRRELRHQILHAIAELPEKYREIIILRDINGLSYEEISRCLELEEGTVKSRISRAREKLRVFLSKTGNFSEETQSKKEERGGFA